MILKPNRLRLSIGLAAMLALTSCTQDELTDSTNTLPEGMYPLEIASATLSVESSEQPWTKVAETTDGKGSTFTANDAITVSLGGETATYTYDGSAWTAGEPLYWESTSSAIVSAWYPATDGTISLADQTDGLAYVLKGSGEGSYQSAVSLTFKHQLAKVRVKLEGKIGDITSVSIVSYTSCTHSQGNISTTGATTGDIAMHKVDDATWEANVVPGQEISTITVNTVNNTEATLTTSITPEAGKMHTINLTVTNEQGYDVSSDGTYTVYTAEGLQAWAAAVRNNLSTNCTLAANIDMTGQQWDRIGDSGTNQSVGFSGTFDGGGYTISNLTSSYALFNGGSECTIKNVTLVNPQIKVTEYHVAGIVGQLLGGSIFNCHVIGGNISCEPSDNSYSAYAGGIAGSVWNAAISACSSTATVSTIASTNTFSYAGGVVGNLRNGTLTACYYAGESVTAQEGTHYAGGVVGCNSNAPTLTACYWSSSNELTGVGNGVGTVTQVIGNVTWSTAAEAMNEALTGTGYQWVVNESSDVPLVLVSE